jgi:hypothetical protein
MDAQATEIAIKAIVQQIVSGSNKPLGSQRRPKPARRPAVSPRRSRSGSTSSR